MESNQLTGSTCCYLLPSPRWGMVWFGSLAGRGCRGVTGYDDSERFRILEGRIVPSEHGHRVLRSHLLAIWKQPGDRNFWEIRNSQSARMEKNKSSKWNDFERQPLSSPLVDRSWWCSLSCCNGLCSSDPSLATLESLITLVHNIYSHVRTYKYV